MQGHLRNRKAYMGNVKVARSPVYTRRSLHGEKANHEYIIITWLFAHFTQNSRHSLLLEVRKGDVRSASVGSLNIKGLFHFSVSRYSQCNLAEADHINDLHDSGKLYIRIDSEHMGVGGDDSWSRSVHDEYLLRKKHYHYQITLAAD